MGAAVEVLGSAVNRLKVFTDERGFYSAGDLKPGVYSIKVSAASFLPALREKVDLRASASAVVNVTLNTLFEAIQWGPVRAPSRSRCAGGAGAGGGGGHARTAAARGGRPGGRACPSA